MYEQSSTPRQEACLECGKRLYPLNKTGYCREHEYASNRPSIKKKYCKIRKCRKRLRFDNATGYCTKHDHFSPEVKAKVNAFKREQYANDPEYRQRCIAAAVRHAKEHPEQIRARQPKRTKYMRKWAKANPDKYKALQDKHHQIERERKAELKILAAEAIRLRAGKRGRGKPIDVEKQELFRTAAAFYESDGKDQSWGQVARRVIPVEYSKNPKAAADRIRQGATPYLSKSSSKQDER